MELPSSRYLKSPPLTLLHQGCLLLPYASTGSSDYHKYDYSELASVSCGVSVFMPLAVWHSPSLTERWTCDF